MAYRKPWGRELSEELAETQKGLRDSTFLSAQELRTEKERNGTYYLMPKETSQYTTDGTATYALTAAYSTTFLSTRKQACNQCISNPQISPSCLMRPQLPRLDGMYQQPQATHSVLSEVLYANQSYGF